MPLKILLVEPDAEYARLLSEILADDSAAPFELSQIAGPEALPTLGWDQFDAILLDLSSANGNRLDTFIQLRAKVPQVPIVVLTSSDDPELARQLLRGGAQDYLVKAELFSSPLVRALRYAIERHRLQNDLREQPLRDALTGLYNRPGFFAFAEKLLTLAQRADRGLALLLSDLDGMREINDQFGQGEGNLALIRVATILQETFRASDVIARLGGDEFAIVAVDASHETAPAIRSRLQHNLERSNAEQALRYRLSLSLGIALFEPTNRLSLEELVAKAEDALYDDQQRNRRLRRSSQMS